MKKKLSILLFCVLGALIVLLGVITYINFQSGDKYKKQVLSQAQQKYQNRTMPAKRGTIYDRNGNILATSNKVYNVVLDCKAVNSDEDYLDPTVNALVTIFGLDEGELRTRLTSDKTKESRYQIVKKQVSMDDKKAFEDYCSIPDDTEMTREEIQEKNNIQGVWFEEDYLRVYPYNELACDTLGFTFSRDTADYGIEGYYNSSRTGIDLPNEGYGIMHTVDTMHETELACSAFGQGFSCTMIQEINAMCSVINGGYYYQPHLVTKVKDASGATVKTISPLLQKLR